MRVLVQRVSRASVEVDGETVGAIGPGLLLFVGVMRGDDDTVVMALASKVANLRIFDDESGGLNRSALNLLHERIDVGVLVVSQFTLYADLRRGRRPSFVDAAPPAAAEPLVARFTSALDELGFAVAEGRFGAHMAVSLVNDGPVTLWLDSAELQRPRRASRPDNDEG